MTTKKIVLIIFLGVLLVLGGGVYFAFFSFGGPTPKGQKGAAVISHEIWDGLLKKYVNVAGMVDYEGFIDSRETLEAYTQLLSQNPPAPNWPENEKLAYWINAYNAFTVKVIADNYPLESIRDLHTLPGVATIWHKEFFEIGGQPTSLNQIEHEILRKEFEEPRIHFAINCASMSCPVLRDEAYIANKLEAQLTEQARAFLNQPLRNRITADKLELSSIFSWFSGDFTRKGDLISFLNKYAPIEIHPDAEITYLDYDWSLNEQK